MIEEQRFSNLEAEVHKISSILSKLVEKSSATEVVEVPPSIPLQSKSKVVSETKESSRKRSLTFSGDAEGKFYFYLKSFHVVNVLSHS